jgi:hypothetical protein
MRKSILKIIVFCFTAILFLPFSIVGQEVGMKLRVVSELANVRIKPDIGSAIIKQFPLGTILESSGKEKEWYQIRFELEGGESLTGYVHRSLVQLMEGELPQEIVLQEEVVKAEELKIVEIKKEEEIEEPEKEKVVEQKVVPMLHNLLADDSDAMHVSVLLYLGGHLASIGDLNAGAMGLGEYYEDLLGITGRGTVSELKMVYQFGAEFLLPLNPKLSFLIGADYLIGEKESLVDFTSGPAVQSFTTRPKIQALPVRVGLAYFPVSGLYAKAGVEFIITNCRYFYRFVNGNFWRQWDGDASSHGLGITGGIGYVLQVNSVIGVFAEASGRYAHIKGLDGTDHFTDSDGADSTENGKLYIYQGNLTGDKSYSLLYVLDKIPYGGGVSDPREATLNLSGFSLKGGIKIRF